MKYSVVFLPKVIEPGLAGHPPQSIPSNTFGTVPWFIMAWEEFTVCFSASLPNICGSGWFLSLDIFAHPQCDCSDSSYLFSPVSDKSLAPFCQEFTTSILSDFFFSDPITLLSCAPSLPYLASHRGSQSLPLVILCFWLGCQLLEAGAPWVLFIKQLAEFSWNAALRKGKLHVLIS